MLEERIWFKWQAEQSREEYEAMITYFCDNLFDVLDYLTVEEWEEAVSNIWETMYWPLDEEPEIIE